MRELTRSSHAWLPLIFALALSGCNEETVEPLELNGPPDAIAPTGGDGQSAIVGSELPLPLSVQVTDAAGAPVPAVGVTWTVSGGTLTSPADTTDANGSSAVRWRMPDSPGDLTATAMVPGLGTVNFAAEALPLVGQLVFRFVDAGAFHACGLTTTDELVCWGYNADGQLGTAASSPALYPTLIPGSTRYRLLSGGRYHACGLDFAFEVTCWGENRDQRAGPPAPPSFRDVDAGLVHSCALTLDDEIHCWGWNDEGELGAADPDSTSSDLNGGWDAVSAGGLHTCAIQETGAAMCWGFNEEGQVGNGGSGTVMTPSAVSGGFIFLTDPLVVPPQPDPDFPLPDGPFIAAGFEHTCALTTAGAARCWGLNQDGQLGDGTLTLRRTPALVTGGLVFSRITAGLAHSCALTSAGAAYCWGDNTWGQLGEGTTSDATAPVAVAGGLIFSYLKAGDNFTCGVTTTGVAYCWGDNHYGQLGTGTNDASLVPVKVALQP